jgi:hypothetical protein
MFIHPKTVSSEIKVDPVIATFAAFHLPALAKFSVNGERIAAW